MSFLLSVSSHRVKCYSYFFSHFSVFNFLSSEEDNSREMEERTPEKPFVKKTQNKGTYTWTDTTLGQESNRISVEVR